MRASLLGRTAAPGRRGIDRVSGAVAAAATFPFTAKGAADAHQYLHDRKNFGKVVLARGAT